MKQAFPAAGGEIAYGEGSVWATLLGFPITRIDPATNKVVQQWTGKGGDSIRVGFGSVWLTELDAGVVWRLDPAELGDRYRFPLSPSNEFRGPERNIRTEHRW